MKTRLNIILLIFCLIAEPPFGFLVVVVPLKNGVVALVGGKVIGVVILVVVVGVGVLVHPSDTLATLTKFELSS